MNSQIISDSYTEQQEIVFNKELFTLISCTVFLLIGLLLLKNDFSIVAIGFYVIAFAIGGYSKIKMDIKKAIETKSFNRGIAGFLLLIILSISQLWAIIPIFVFIVSLDHLVQMKKQINI